MMGRAHAYAYRAAPLIRPSSITFTPVVMSGRNALAVAKVSADCGITSWVEDWHELIERNDVDVVDVCTPPGTHAAIIEGGRASGQRRLLREASRNETTRTLVPHATPSRRRAFVTRLASTTVDCRPSSLMAEMIANGELGEVHLWRGTWLSDEFVEPRYRLRLPFRSRRWAAARLATSAVT